MAERKIPPFLSDKHHTAPTVEAKKQVLEHYDIWSSHSITQSYKLWLEKQLEALIKEDEEKTDWLSFFHYKYKQAHNKGQRALLRKLLKQIN
jgi:hypothetical protein